MVEQLTYIESNQSDPYRNLAVEEYLLLHCEEKECILYLWQNQRTVVIGRNQNAWKECLVSSLEQEGGHLVRRLSGGGAVYHDLGNLNFTFLVRKKNYNVQKQLEVILRAVERLGLAAEISGRNDVLIEGRKFSGNAFYEQGDFCYHHGTLMLGVDVTELSRYLTVSKAKLESKGVNSVESRVANLREWLPELTVEACKQAMRLAFEEVYGHEGRTLRIEELPREEIQRREQRFASWEWKFGRKLDFQYELSRRFSWGEVVLQLQVDGGRIRDLTIYSDSLRGEEVAMLRENLRGIRYQKEEICRSLAQIPCETSDILRKQQDILTWMREIDF